MAWVERELSQQITEINNNMSYAKEIGKLLAEELQELVLLDEMNLTEIRDLKTLKGHIKSAAAKYGTKHPKYKALLNLQAKKKAAEERKQARLAHVKERQEHHAKSHGYKRVKGSPNTWAHESGHTLTFGDDRSWHHVKAGKKKGVGGNATPLRDLHNHLRSLHEEAIAPLQEIRALERIKMAMNKDIPFTDPEHKQRVMRLQALERRQRSAQMRGLEMGMREDEKQPEQYKMGYTAYALTDASRKELLHHYKPKFPEVICHHVTYKFPASSTDELPPAVKEAHIVGYASQDGPRGSCCRDQWQHQTTGRKALPHHAVARPCEENEACSLERSGK